MRLIVCLFGQIAASLALFPGAEPDEGDVRHVYPMIYIGVGLDTHAHAIPYIFGWLENVFYPKVRMRIEIFIGSREDSTIHQVKWWIDSTKQHYRHVKLIENSENWLEEALRNGRLQKAERCLLFTGDTVPTDYTMLRKLFNDKKHIVVSPLFQSIDGSANIENVSENLIKMVNVREEIEIFALPCAINLNSIDSSYLTFDSQNLPFYEGPNAPIEVFTESAKKMGIALWGDHQSSYGIYVNPSLDLADRRRTIRYQIADMIADDKIVPYPSKTVRPWQPEPELFGMNRIYMINLKRRNERLERMRKIFAILAIDFTLFEATDGQKLDELGDEYRDYRILDGYLDPISNRPMKNGEIGCFLSHYRIWQDVVKNDFEKVIVFEDDLRFAHDGMERVNDVVQDLDASKKLWDLIYLGRKKQSDKEELWVNQHRHLSTVEYSYWTLGYMLSLEGAKKLLAPNPLKKVIPVDEYLPIMFDKHPNKTWSSSYEPRNLEAFTLYPLVVYPQRYTNEPGYVSDTEDSLLVKPASDKNSYAIRFEMGCVLSSADLAGEGYRMKIVKEIAKGGFSEILLCEDIDSHEKYAVKKVVSNSDEETERIQNEAKVLRELLDVPNAVQLIAMINEVNQYFFVFPYYFRGNLGDELAKRRINNNYLSEIQVLRYFEQICMVVEKLHEKSYAHRDLKTANFLISQENDLHLTDFGSCSIMPKEIKNSKDHQIYVDEAAELCSMPYRAPELFSCDIGTTITTSIDIWSLGCCLYAFCFFVSPFDAVYEKGGSIALATQSPHKIVYPDDGGFSDDLKDLIKCMIQVEPDLRPSIGQILEMTREIGKNCENGDSKIVSV
ncbi:unnamed protein product [Caenorhabditis bovis]|uniref:non-specific serine/threonine protein kinase n=1 Tax=Caenorhabditis bovis TaxID=2654633 RepID=A0A8S1ETV0_9PELO|nr:unnamed protein product [Caenorhabditis bovis]